MWSAIGDHLKRI